MDAPELFDSLESDNLQVVEDVKKQFADFFNKSILRVYILISRIAYIHIIFYSKRIMARKFFNRLLFRNEFCKSCRCFVKSTVTS